MTVTRLDDIEQTKTIVVLCLSSSSTYNEMSMITTFAVVALATISGAEAQTQWCYNRYGQRYRCNRSGLSYGARIGIGVGIAAGELCHPPRE